MAMVDRTKKKCWQGACIFILLLVAWNLAESDAAFARRSSSSSSVAQAIDQARATGRPIFAVAGASYCPACVRLLNTLNTDESLRPLIAEFVPLKINSASPEYAHWKKFFPPEKSAIPALYIVTPEGKQLFGKVGALPSKNLQKVLLSSLEKAGRYPSKKEWQKFAETLDEVERLLEEEKPGKAAVQFHPVLANLNKLGTLAEYSKTGRRAQQLASEVASHARKVVGYAIEQLIREETFGRAFALASVEQAYGAFPELGLKVEQQIKREVRSTKQRKLLRQARELQKAKSLARDPETRRRGVADLKRMAKRHASSPVGNYARETLESLENR